MSESSPKQKNSKSKILSDDEVNEMYSKLENESNLSDELQENLGKFKKMGDSVLDKSEDVVNSSDKIIKEGISNTYKKTSDIVNKIEHSKPVFEKFKRQSTDEFNEFTSKSTLKLKDFGTKLKSLGEKYVDKTKSELDESKNFLKSNAPATKNKIKEEFGKGTNSLKKNVPKMGHKTKSSFLDSIEKIYGASTIGKQYGAKSADLLFKLGELKTSDLISQEEYDAKKKEILKRI